MDLTRAQRFAYTLTLLVFFTTLTMVLLNVYAIDVFLVLLVSEFLIVIELTRPLFLAAVWRKNLRFFIVFWVIVVVIIVYFRIRAIYH